MFLVRYNEAPGNNPLSLLPAFELYERDTYRALVKRFGIDKAYILSAGWGLIPASFLTPCYDVTFAANADDWKRRRKRDAYNDLSMLLPMRTKRSCFSVGRTTCRSLRA